MAIDWNSLKKQEKVLESRLKQYDNRGSSASAPKSTSSPTRANAPSYRTALEGLKAGALPISRMVADRAPALADLEPKTEEQAERLDTAREKTGSDFLITNPMTPLEDLIDRWENEYERASRRVDALRSGPVTARRDQSTMREAVDARETAYETLQSLKRRQLNRAYLDRSRKAVRDIRRDSGASEDFERIGQLEDSEATIRRLLDEISRGADPSEYAAQAQGIEDLYGVSLDSAGSVGEYMNQLTDLLGQLPEETERLAKELTDAGYAVEDAAEYLGRQKDIEAAARGQARWQEMAREHPVLASAATVVAAPAQGVEAVGAYLANWGHNASDPETYRPINTARDMSSTRFVDTVRGTVAQELEENTSLTVGGQNVASFLYQTGMSIADSAVQVAVLGKAAPILMGASAAANQAYDVLQRGGTNEEAFWGGVAAGAAEMLFEKVSVENLLKPRTISGWKSVLSSALEQAGVEATEEGLTEIANILSDAAIMGSSSNFERSIQAHMADGDTREEAERKAFLDAIGQVAAASVGGAISGGVMAGVKASVARAERKAADTYTGKTLQQAQENFDLVDMGLNYQEDSETYRQAQAIARKLDTADDPVKAVSAEEYGQLLRAMQSELESKGPKTGEERHDAVQAMHPEEKVITPTAQAFIDAGESPAKADAKSVILDRVLSGDDTVTDAQLRKLDLQSPATRQVFTAFTGIQVPTTTDTKTLLATFRSAISEAKQVQQLQAALERDTMASVTALRQQAEAAAVASENRAQEQVEAQPAAQETAAAQGIDQKVVKAAQAALKGDVFSGARGKKLEQLGLSREDVTAALQQVASGQPDMSSATVQQVAGVLSGGKRKTTAGDVFRPKGETKAQAELAVRDTRPTPDVQLSDGTSMTAQEFVDDYIATHEGATVQDANRVYSEAVRLNQTGMKFPAARKQESTAARSSVSPRRRKATSEGKRTTQRKPVSERTVQADAASVKAEAAPTSDRVPSRVQRWTASYASALLKGSQIKGIDVAFDGFGEGERGFYQDGRIVLNGNMLTTQRAIMQVLGHELTHPAYDADQTIVNDILATARKFRGDEWMDRAMDETRDRYIRFLMEQKGLTRDEATAQMTPTAVKQEVAGDFMFDVFSDGSLTRRLGSEAPSILYKARSLAARLLERLAGVRGTDAAAARSELEWLVDRLDGALRVNESDDTMGTKRSSVEDPVFQTEEKPIPYLSDEQEQQWEQRINEAAEKFGLSDDEANGISLYVCGSAYEWTSIQRGEGKYEQTPLTDFFIGQTQAGLERMPTFQGRTYRNLRFTDEGAYRAFLQEYETGEDVTLRAFTSASKDPNGYVALGDYTVHLVIDGVSGRDIADNFSGPGQREVIYLPGSVLHIDSATTANDGHPLIYAKERADNGENPEADRTGGREGSYRADTEGFGRGEEASRIYEGILSSGMGERRIPDDQPRSADAPEAQGRELTGEASPEGGRPRYSVALDQLVEELERSDPDDRSPVDVELQRRTWMLPEVRQVRNASYNNTKARPGRRKIRQKVLNELMERGSWNGESYSGPVSRNRRADIVIGLPGSGKSSMAVNPLSQAHNSRVIDSDMAKELLPEYDSGKGAGNVHEESSMIRDALMNYATEDGDNLVWATVGSNQAALEDQIEMFKREGYSVYLHLVDVTPKQALARTLRRFHNTDGTEGRYTPPRVVFDAWDFPRQNFINLQREGGLDGYQIYDNRARRDADGAAAGTAGREAPEPQRRGTESAEGAEDAGYVRPEDGSPMRLAGGGGDERGAVERTLDDARESVPGRTRRSGSAVPGDREIGISDDRIREIAETESFQEWFHDGNGELIDQNTGLPVAPFHGTKTAWFTRFEKRPGGEAGFWFAKNPHTSDQDYYTGRGPDDPPTREFAPIDPTDWAEAEEFLYQNLPVLEMELESDGGRDQYVVRDGLDGVILRTFTPDDTGLEQFKASYPELAQAAYEMQSEDEFSGMVHSDGGTPPPAPGMYQVFLSMRNPMVVHAQGQAWNKLNPFMVDDERTQRALLDRYNTLKMIQGYVPPMETRQFAEMAQELGYDGVIFRDVSDGRVEDIVQPALERPGLEQKLFGILDKYNNFGAPDREMALAQIEVTGIPGQVTMDEAAVLQEYLELPEARTTLEAIPDDVYVVFDSEQIKSVHNEGTFDPANPDIRYSVSSTQPFAEQVRTALREDTAENRLHALYIRSTPSLLRELGLPDTAMAMTARHVKDINHAPGENLSWHGIPEEQIIRIPELLEQPAMVLESGTRPGDIVVVTTELDSEGRPIVLTVHPNGSARVDGRMEPTNFITSMYGRNNFGRFLDAVVRNGGVLYWDKNRSQDLLTAARVQFPAGMRDLASDSIIRKIGGSVNENRSRTLSSKARVQFPAAFTASASDTTISQLGTDVNGERVPGTPRFSVQEGNVNPDTGYETGSVADSVMRMINAGDVDEALKMMGDVLKQFQKIEAEQASRKKQSNAAAAFRPRQTLTEDLIAKNKRTIEELIEKYGAMEQTSAAQRTVLLPKAIDKETKVRGVMQTAAATENTPEYLLSEIERDIVEGSAGATYVSIGDKGSLKRAENLLKDKGFETLLHEWRAKIDAGVRLDKTDIVMAEKLYVEAANNKDTATAMQLLSEIAMAGTQSGQIVQAMTMLKNMTPSGQLYYLQKTVDRFNTERKDLRLLGKEIAIDPGLARKLLEAKTQEEIDTAMGDLIQNIADQLPVTLLDRWNAWRYLAMLGNPRTHIRNLFGNAIFTPARLAKDVLATAGERLLQSRGIITQEERTKAFSTKETRDFAKADSVGMERILRGGGKQNIADQIRDARKIFGDTPIEWLSRKNSELLEWEDWIFLRSAYEHALAGFLAARKADVSTLSGADSTREGRALLNEARAYAVREAQKATYRDVSKLASMLSHLKRTGGPAAQIFLDGLIPFTKTPINIVKRGVEYSPVGLLKSITVDLNRVRKGEISATEAVDNICAGLTGTGIVAMGYVLAKMGILVGGFGDEPEDEFQELQGEQSYSLRLGDVSYTIDWTAPVALPLFVGAEIDRLSAGEFSAGDLPDAIATLLEPVLSLSMLDGLNSTLASVRYDSADQALVNILKTVGGSYLTQGVPTLAGQIARTMDDSRRTSFTPTGMGSLQSWASRTYQTSVLGKIPVASEQRMLYIDAWGRSDTEPNIALRALENFLSPGYANTIQTTSVDRELIRLAEETKDTGVFPKRATKYFTVGGEQYAMTQDEYEAHLIERGQMSYQLVSDLTSTPDYAKLPDAAKVQAVQAAYTYASELAKYHTNAEYDADSWVLRLDVAGSELGLDPEDYFIAKALSKQNGSSIREAALGAGFDPATTAAVIAADFSAQGSFTDPYTPKHEYVLNSEQKERYESMFREKFVSAYIDYGLGQLTGTELSDEVSDLVSEINTEVKREMSDWLYGQGISPTPKN